MLILIIVREISCSQVNFPCKFQMFNDAIAKATEYKKNPTDIDDQILDELERM